MLVCIVESTALMLAMVMGTSLVRVWGRGGEERVEVCLDRLYACETRLHEQDGRRPARADRLGRRLEARAKDVLRGSGHRPAIASGASPSVARSAPGP